jgi:hypothetical protein
MASGRPPGGFWAPGVPQMAAQAALALVALWPALRVVLGPSWASRGAPRRLAGELREVILEGILKVEPEIWENHKVLTCSMV